MLNILSLRCGLAFAPYLIDAASAFLNEGGPISRVIRQGGTGLIIRSGDGVAIRYQNREIRLGREEVRHYLATFRFRRECFDIMLTSDEVVLANFGGSVLLSHPQSDLWLDRSTLEHLISIANYGDASAGQAAAVPEWLSLSAGADRLLLSDQRNGRWVLLGTEHLGEFERRLRHLEPAESVLAGPAPPTISLKGVTVHLQSARRLAEGLRGFADTGQVSPFEEVAPTFALRVARSTEGLELSDSNVRVGISSREAHKWAGVIGEELSRLNVVQTERGSIRTVFADGDGGRWVLQWGDEVFVPTDQLSGIGGAGPQRAFVKNASLTIGRVDEVVLLLSVPDSACAALTAAEVQQVVRESGY